MFQKLKILLLFLSISFAVWGQQNADCMMHEVKAGQTIYRMSVIYNIKVSQILAANPELGKDPTIYAGQKICIPQREGVIYQSNESRFSNSLASANPQQANGAWFHIVQRGETFYDICNKYKILAYDLIAANELSNTIVKENQKLWLPATAVISDIKSNETQDVSPLVKMTQDASITRKENVEGTEIHIVKSGDTYYNITKRYGMYLNELGELNHLSTSLIKIGQQLKVIDRLAIAAAVNKAPPTAIETGAAKTEPVQEEKTKEEIKNLVEEEAVQNKKDEIKIPDDATLIEIAKKTSKQKEKEKREKEKLDKKEQETQARLDVVAAIEEHKISNKMLQTDSVLEEAAEILPSSIIEEDEVKTNEADTAVMMLATSIDTNSNNKEVLADATLAKVEMPPADVKEIIPPKAPLDFAKEYAKQFQNKTSDLSLKIGKQRGVAALSDNIIGNEHLAYCNTCAPGSVVKITNLMSKRSTYVKVLGKTGNDAMIVVSSKLVSELDIIDGDFLVEISSHVKK